MEIIKVHKQGVLKLIKDNTYSFYERWLYIDLTIDIVLDSRSEFDLENRKMLLSFEDLATLLFDRVVCNDAFTLVVH